MIKKARDSSVNVGEGLESRSNTHQWIHLERLPPRVPLALRGQRVTRHLAIIRMHSLKATKDSFISIECAW